MNRPTKLQPESISYGFYSTRSILRRAGSVLVVAAFTTSIAAYQDNNDPVRLFGSEYLSDGGCLSGTAFDKKMNEYEFTDNKLTVTASSVEPKDTQAIEFEYVQNGMLGHMLLAKTDSETKDYLQTICDQTDN